MSDDEIKLLPCPFCGGDAVMEQIDGVLGVRKSAGCRTETCMGYQSNMTFSTHREAALAWNTRAPHCPKCKSADIERCHGKRKP